MTGYLHLIVPTSRFRLLSGAEDLVEYTFQYGCGETPLLPALRHQELLRPAFASRRH
jgi:hypothetical protein